MWSDANLLSTIAVGIVVVAFGVYIQRIDQCVRLVKMRLDRLSVTFLKIENDLTAIQDSITVLAAAIGGDAAEDVLKIRNRRPKRLKWVIENGPDSAEILRGLEFPDFHDDPAFWAEDRMKRFGLETEPENDEGKNI